VEKLMNIGIVGCGFVADYYINTLQDHPELNLIGVTDRDPDRAARFAAFYRLQSFNSLQDVLSDHRIELVLNLTNPRSHYEVTKEALEAGKHVYSEKPLAMEFHQAQELVERAECTGLRLASAPCNLLSETAQTIWKALRQRQIGTVRLVYADLDDGMVYRMAYDKWLSASGTPWPAKEEFEVGCTFEHAGYYLSWFPAFFGPAKTVTAFSARLMPPTEVNLPLEYDAPDFSVACITFDSGVVARLTCSIIAPRDHRLRIIGDEGVLGARDCWSYRSPVQIQRPITIRRRTLMIPWKKHCRLATTKSAEYPYLGAKKMDFARGVAELADSIRQRRPCRLSERYSLHVNELVIAIDHAHATGSPYRVTTTFEPVEPMPWAR
jgi:predicted dehydrogenase